MPEVVGGNTPRSEVGIEALTVVTDVASRYLKLDIARVQEACEAERTRKLTVWRTLSAQTVPELNVRRLTAIEEATPVFELYMPRKVTLMIEENRDSYDTDSSGLPRRAAQTTAPNDETREATVTTYVKWVRSFLDQLWVVDPASGGLMTSLKLSTVHELAHASGDHPPRVAFDAVRGYIAVQVIGRLLGEIIEKD